MILDEKTAKNIKIHFLSKIDQHVYHVHFNSVTGFENL